jgi:transcription elongation GreA/GreB family factor
MLKTNLSPDGAMATALRNRQAHQERTMRLLEARLEALAAVTERSLSGARPVAAQILALEAATRHAVRLHVLSRDEAGAIWASVAERHPSVAWCQAGCPSLAA